MNIRTLPLTLAIGLATIAATAHARPHAQEPLCRISLTALETVALEESLETVTQKLGCPGRLRSVEVVGDVLRFHTRVWPIDVTPYGEFRGEFINGQLHGMTKAWLDLLVTY